MLKKVFVRGNMSVFVERLKEYMEDSSLSVTALAKKIGVTRETASNIVNEAHMPSTKAFVALIEYFNCSADYLLGIIDIPQNDSFGSVKPFGKILKKCLKDSGKSEYRLQEDLMVSSSLTYRWLNDKATPTINYYIRLAKYFGCSIDYLLGREV